MADFPSSYVRLSGVVSFDQQLQHFLPPKRRISAHRALQHALLWSEKWTFRRFESGKKDKGPKKTTPQGHKVVVVTIKLSYLEFQRTNLGQMLFVQQMIQFEQQIAMFSFNLGGSSTKNFPSLSIAPPQNQNSLEKEVIPKGKWSSNHHCLVPSSSFDRVYLWYQMCHSSCE